MSLSLSNKALDALPKNVGRPTYDRGKLSPGILHVGVGNFHRSHQAVYVNDLLNAGGNPAWGILGAGVRETDAAMRAMLSEQDWLYSVIEVDFEALSVSVIGAMIDFAPVVPNGNGPLISAMTNPETKIVSLTVTEGGYFLDAATGKFDVSHPAIVKDIAIPAAPCTVFGAIIAALAERKSQGTPPFTIMSCDNLPGNGDITRNVVVALAKAIDFDLSTWIEDSVLFPNGMVDRITPATGDRERTLLKEHLAIEDNFPVFCEPFRQWVLEDKFVNGRPELEAVGVQFTDDIHQFEKMKIRILNGGHAILAYASAMLGVEFAHEAMAMPLIKEFLRKVLRDDVLKFVPNVPGCSPEEYLDLICKRFENPGVADTIDRLCHDGSNRQPKFIVPSIRENLDGGKTPQGLALSSALWCQYCNGVNDLGKTIAANDPNWTELQSTARRSQDHPAIWLAQSAIYGSLERKEKFTNAFSSALNSLKEIGTEETIKAYLADQILAATQ